MGLSMAERLDLALTGQDVDFTDPSGGLPDGVVMDDLTSAIWAVARDAGLSDFESEVLFFLAIAARDLAGWRGAYPAPKVAVPAVWMAKYFRVEAGVVRDALSGLAEKGWLALGAGGPGCRDAIDLRPLLSRWEALCCLAVSSLAVKRAAAYLRIGIAWREEGLGREDTSVEVPAPETGATVAERAVECDRLLLALERLVAAGPGGEESGRCARRT